MARSGSLWLTRGHYGSLGVILAHYGSLGVIPRNSNTANLRVILCAGQLMIFVAINLELIGNLELRQFIGTIYAFDWLIAPILVPI